MGAKEEGYIDETMRAMAASGQLPPTWRPRRQERRQRVYVSPQMLSDTQEVVAQLLMLATPRFALLVGDFNAVMDPEMDTTYALGIVCLTCLQSLAEVLGSYCPISLGGPEKDRVNAVYRRTVRFRPGVVQHPPAIHRHG
ncbi:hypothetical protein NDU88_001267 [Pleurodeles waltl]|uniref:Endonuclease/exonuclease/phosphatase domain-containing protein n=1 Tax=Pleurodeles waltl TaxID=8319 RepID=A0AAV7M2P8_PLEWA|nr:hypothetical protein NDU88_001267 [Pleurodeles waltl]